LGGNISGIEIFIGFLLAVLLLLPLFIAIVQLIKKPFTNILEPKWIFIFLLIGNIVGIIIENKLFGINYPEDRTGLYFFPLLIGSFFFGIDSLQTSKKIILIAFTLPLFIFPIHFFASTNLSWSSLENEVIPQRFYQTITKFPTKDKYPPSVEGYQKRLMRWSYFNFSEKGEQFSLQQDGYPTYVADFQIASSVDSSLWKNYYDSIDGDPQSEIFLLQRKNMLWKKLLFSKAETPVHQQNDQYFELYRGSMDTLAGKNLYIGFTINISSKTKPFNGWIVTSVATWDKIYLRYEYTPLSWYRTDWLENGKDFTNGHFIADLPEGASRYVTYIWNIDKINFTVNSYELEVFELTGH